MSWLEFFQKINSQQIETKNVLEKNEKLAVGMSIKHQKVLGVTVRWDSLLHIFFYSYSVLAQQSFGIG